MPSVFRPGAWSVTASGKPLPVTIIDNETIRGMTAGAAGSPTRATTLARAAALGAASGSRSSAGITALALTSRPASAAASSRPGPARGRARS